MITKRVLVVVCLIAMFAALYWQTPLADAQAVPDGLASYWNFENVAGKTVRDEVGGNDGTIMEGDLKTARGKFGNGLEFDGKGYVHIDAEVMEFGDGYSITAWIKTAQNNTPIFSKGNGAAWEQHEKELYIANAATSEGPNTGPVEMVGWGCDWIRGSEKVDDDKWHHIAITWDDGAGEGHAYVDGVEGTHEVTYNGCPDNAGNTIRLGFSESGHSAGNFVGLMDEVRLYERGLTEKEVNEIMDDAAAVEAADKLTVTWGAIKTSQ